MTSVNKHIAKIIACLCLLCALPNWGKAQVVYTGEPITYFGNQTKYFATSEPISFQEAYEQVDAFEELNFEVPNLGVTSSQHWLHFTIDNESASTKLNFRIDYPNLDQVRFYALDGDGQLVDSVVTGEAVAFDQRANEIQDFVFPLQFDESNHLEILVSIQSGEQVMVPMRIQDDEELLTSLSNEYLYFGLYLGLILVMLFYNFFVYLSIRDRAYLLYVIYIFTVGLTQAVLHGFAYKILWPGSPGIALSSVYLVGAASGIAVLLFTREYLKIRNTSVWIDNFLLFFGWLDIVAVLFTFFGLYNIAYNLINLVAALGSFSILMVAIYFARLGQRSAQFFLIAWSIFLLSVVLYVFRDVGWLPYNRFTENILLVGSGIEVVLLSFALADRINVLKREREEARLREFEAVKLNETLVKEQNILLEQKVEERTQELSEANQQLNRALDELKQAQVQLVNAEKMASLGQLTAGIAHEINNPINFVAASVEPLQRDIVDIKKLIDHYQQVIDQCADENGKLRAEKIREEMDYEFTMQEIDELLLGVDEGARRTAEIVLGLKNFSRLDESESKQSSVHECLNSTLIVLRNVTKDHVSVIREFDPAMEEIECYPGKLNQVFSNIIVNAVQAMEGMEHPELTIRTKFHKDQGVEVSISDNGPGIPDEIKQKIFEPFFTTKDVGLGTGLGLSIVYSIIEQHQGTVELNSEVGRGTEFLIRLPITFEH
jgi:signal transduction histidine kinase